MSSFGFFARDRMIATVVDVAKGQDSEEFVFEETGPPRVRRAIGELENMDNVEEKRLLDTWGASRLSEIFGRQLSEAIQRRVTATCTALVTDPARLAQVFADQAPEPGGAIPTITTMRRGCSSARWAKNVLQTCVRRTKTRALCGLALPTK